MQKMETMHSIKFKCYSISNEININNLSKQFGFENKLQWNEPLILQSEQLKNIVNFSNYSAVYIFSFGSIVFLNFADSEINKFLNYVNAIEKNSLNTSKEYSDEYNLIVAPNGEITIKYNCLSVPKLENRYCYLIATVLAKSTALYKIESEINVLSDNVENIINKLKKSYLKISNETLSKIYGEILSFKYETISYIMLLDKPDMTWEDERSQYIYGELTKLFELNDRYEKINNKTGILLDIVGIFADLSHTKTNVKLEWIVIVLIFVEVAFFVFTYFAK
ncbi:RMD1 family protein [Thermoanaerobacterium thermosaccharolyticum]|uniref:RMD1 family protein n=2 Tax=Thermoanaerobacterium thermosaccharolyticum TaxID=1517 RepID=UPI003DAA1CD5